MKNNISSVARRVQLEVLMLGIEVHGGQFFGPSILVVFVVMYNWRWECSISLTLQVGNAAPDKHEFVCPGHSSE